MLFRSGVVSALDNVDGGVALVVGGASVPLTAVKRVTNALVEPKA